MTKYHIGDYVQVTADAAESYGDDICMFPMKIISVVENNPEDLYFFEEISFSLYESDLEYPDGYNE